MLTLFLMEILLCTGILLFSLCLFLFYRERKARILLAAKYQAMELLHKNARKQYELLIKQINELRFNDLRMGKKMIALSRYVEELAEKQNQMTLCDSDSKLYSRANKMAELGADLNELMQECELPQAEAELLLNLKKNQQFIKQS